MVYTLILGMVGGALTVIGTAGFILEGRVDAWEPKALFCLHTLGLMVLGLAAVLSLMRRIGRLENEVEQAEKRRY